LTGILQDGVYPACRNGKHKQCPIQYGGLLQCRCVCHNSVECPRCKNVFDNPWQECDDCITKYYPET